MKNLYKTVCISQKRIPDILEWVPILVIRIGTDLEKKTKINKNKTTKEFDIN